MSDASPQDFYARTYDLSVADWPDELAFYLGLAREVNGPVLELACGTGRICGRLAQAGVQVVGIDRSPQMLDVARTRWADAANLELIEGDMRSFDLGRKFALVIIPGHSFQNLLTADDQAACLSAIVDHLTPNGLLQVHLDHQNVDWLGAISPGGALAGVFEAAETFRDPASGRFVRASRAWQYRRSDQAAVLTSRWDEELDGTVVGTHERGPNAIHCVFRFEMEHLLIRAGFEVESLYGDFARNPLTDESEEMIWVSRLRKSQQPAMPGATPIE